MSLIQDKGLKLDSQKLIQNLSTLYFEQYKITQLEIPPEESNNRIDFL